MAIPLVVLAFAACTSLYLGQDANWDLLNYHLRGPFTVLTGRLATDFDPSSLQSYFNPTLDFPYYWLGTGPLSHHPKVLAALLGLPFGLLILGARALARRVLGGPAVLHWIAAIAAVTGAATLSQIATAFNEVKIAAILIGGLLAAVASADALPGRRLQFAGLAGVLFGIAAGLKLNALIHAPAIGIAMLLVLPFLPWLRWAICFSIAWLCGFLACAGWWCWLLWQQFGSPFFPMFNTTFKSPWFPVRSIYDDYFIPKTLWSGFVYPFLWLTKHKGTGNAELPYRDPRDAVFLVAILLFALALLIRVIRKRTLRAEMPTQGTAPTVVMVYAVIAYVLWLTSSAIMRYGIMIDIAGTISVFYIVMRLFSGLGRYGRPAGLVAVAAVALFFVLWTRAPNYNRIPFGDTVFAVDMDWTPPDTLFVAVTGPTAYATIFVPEERHARTVGLSYLNFLAEGSRLEDETIAVVRGHQGPIYLLIPGPPATPIPWLHLLGLSDKFGACRQIRSNLDHDQISACLTTRLTKEASAAPGLH